jgi:UDP-GlcNAc3NAcA epimerase
VKIASIVGARPQFVKAAMVVEAVRTHNRKPRSTPRVQHILVHTGQHYDSNLSGVFFAQLPLPEPRHYLGVGSGSHGKQTGDLLKAVEAVLAKEKPDVALVYGDTNSTLAGALAAAKLQIPVAHVEAGLRSFNRAMPEEINRVVTDHLSSTLFCPTQTAVQHLEHEGIRRGVYFSGDVMLDAILKFRHIAARRSRILSQLDLFPSEYVLFTMHRAENTDSVQSTAAAMELLLQVQRTVVFPIHPRTQQRLRTMRGLQKLAKRLFAARHMRIITPVPYLDMLALEANARVVLTDSGGVQKEAYFLRVPCLTLRRETEWTETLEGGWNRLVDPGNGTASLVEGLWSKNGMPSLAPPNLDAFGNGHAANTIVRQLLQSLSHLRN